MFWPVVVEPFLLVAGLHPVVTVIRRQLNTLLFRWFRRCRLTLRGSVPSDEYDNYSSATLQLLPPDAGCRLVQCVAGTPSTTRRRRRRAGLPATRRWSLHSPGGAGVPSPARRSAELAISRQEHGHARVAGTPLTRWRRVCYVHCRRCCCAVRAF